MAILPRDVNIPYTSGYCSIMHLNARSARNKHDDITTFLDEFSFKFDIIMISETWYTCNDEVLCLPTYKSFFLNRPSRRGGGVLQLIADHLVCSLLSEFSAITPDYEALSLACHKYVYVVVYRPPDGKTEAFFQFLENLLTYACTNKLHIIIGGDCNINLLQQTETTRNFQLLLDSFACANIITEPTRVTLDTESLIDLLITNDISDSTVSGTVIADISDHYPIYMFQNRNEYLNRAKVSTPESYKIQEISNKTLDTFRREIAQICWDPVYKSVNANEAYEIFMCLLRKTYHKCFKYKTVETLKKGRKQWMTRECLEMIKKKNLLYAKFVKTRHHNDLSEFKRYRNFVTKQLRKTKDAYYEALFKRVSTRGDVLWREINKLLNRSCSRDNALELNIDNKIVKGQELANKFNVYFTTLVSSDLSNPSRACNSDYRDFLGVPNMSTAYFLNTTPEEVLSVFMSLKNTTARDIDDLQIRPIKAALDLLLPVLTHLFNICLSTGVFPEKMKHARVSVLYKSGDRNIFSNYRPISILPVISKGLEKIIYQRVMSFCEKYSILSPHQFGFRRGMSTELALLTQKELILNSFEKKLLTLGVFIDYSKAFDRINHEVLYAKLRHYGFRGTPLDFLKSYLSQRKQSVVINDSQSSLLTITSGVPQGSILGPLLFNIYINDITSVSKYVDFIIYADDTSIFFHGNDLGKLADSANNILNDIFIWSTANYLMINTKKSKAVVFAPVQKAVCRGLDIYLGPEKIEVVKEVSSLGVIFNENLNWDEHVNKVTRNIARTCGALSKLRQILPANIKLLLYNTLFSSHINYCSLVWADTSKANRNKIFLLQKKAIRHIANVPYDAHTSHLFREYKILPIDHIHSFNLIMKYKQSLLSNNACFLKLCNLRKNTQSYYDIRKRPSWFVPYSRTNHGLRRLEHCIPACFNMFENKNIDIFNIHKKQLKNLLIQNGAV